MSNPEITKLMAIAKDAVSRKKNDDSQDINKIVADLSKTAALNQEEINRVVEWTNTLKQLRSFKSSMDKTAEFDVADSKKVRTLIYGEELEKESKSYKFNSSLYNLKKKASVSGPTKIPYSQYPVEGESLVKQAVQESSKLEGLLKQAHLEKFSAERNFLSGMQKIAKNLDKHYSESFSEFEQSARDHLGSKSLPYVSMLEKMARNNSERLLNYKPKNVIKESENTELLKSAIANAKLYQVFNELKKYAEDIQSGWNQRLGSYAAKV